MFLDEKQARDRLNSPDNLANKIAAFRGEKKVRQEGPVTFIHEGRDLPRLPDAAKEDIVERANSGLETQQEIAESYGVTQGAVHYLKRSRNEKERESEARTEIKLDKAIKDIAVEKMMLAMGLITEEKLTKLKATDLAAVSAGMAKVVATVQPKSQVPLVNLVVYAPEVRAESSYKVIEIGSSGRETSLG